MAFHHEKPVRLPIFLVPLSRIGARRRGSAPHNPLVLRLIPACCWGLRPPAARAKVMGSQDHGVRAMELPVGAGPCHLLSVTAMDNPRRRPHRGRAPAHLAEQTVRATAKAD